MKKTRNHFFSEVIVSIFAVMIVWWLLIAARHLQNTVENFLFGATLGVLPIVGALFGLTNAQRWGWLKSSMGKATLFLSAGLITWGVGTLVFAYYNIVLQIAVPYPSLADAFYIMSWPLWGIGIFHLSKATGAKYGLNSLVGKYILLFVPLVVVILSYYLLVVVARGGMFHFTDSGMLKIFFDLAYPIGDIIILTMATIIYGLSYNYFGGRFKSAIYLILIGFVINYIADFSFSYTTTIETFYSGDWVDLLFTTAMLLLSLGIVMLNPKLIEEDHPRTV